MSNNAQSDKTLDQLVKGYPYAQRLHSPRQPISALGVARVPVNISTTCERLRKQEIFLTDLLAENRHANEMDDLQFRLDVERLMQRIPYDLLAEQWLHECTLKAEARAYLVEHLLPQLVLGLESVLRDADLRGRTENQTIDNNFNPINRLAEFIMRNNPKYSNLSKLSPYSRGLMRVLGYLREELFLSSDSELARLKAKADKRRADFDLLKEIEAKEEEIKRRKIAPIFDCFLFEGDNQINSVVVQNAIQSFLEVVMKLPRDIQHIERPIVHVKTVEEHVEHYLRSEFLTYVMLYAKPLSMEAFSELINHLQRCAGEYKDHVNRRIKLEVLSDVYISCDQEKSETLNKDKIFQIFDKFAEEANESLKNNLQNPHEWPIREYHLRHEQFDPLDRSVKNLDDHGTNNSATDSVFDASEDHFCVNIAFNDDSKLLIDSQLQKNNSQSLDSSELASEVFISEEVFHESSKPTHRYSSGTREIFESNLESLLKALINEIRRNEAVLWPTKSFKCHSESILTLAQFYNLAISILGRESSVEDVRQFANFMKTSFYESNDEQAKTRSQLAVVKSAERLHVHFNQIFHRFDCLRSGFAFLQDLEYSVVHFRDGIYKRLFIKVLDCFGLRPADPLFSHLNETDKSSEGLLERFKSTSSFKESKDKTFPWMMTSKENTYQFADAVLSEPSFHKILNLLKAELDVASARVNTDAGFFDELSSELLSSKTATEPSLSCQLRMKWLHQLTSTCNATCLRLEPVFRLVFALLQKNAQLLEQKQEVKCRIFVKESNEATATCLSAFPEVLARQCVGKTLDDLGLQAFTSGKPTLQLVKKAASGIEEPVFNMSISIPLANSSGFVHGVLVIEQFIQEFPMAEVFQFYLGISARLESAFRHVQLYTQYIPLLKSAFINLRTWLPGFSEAAFYRSEVNLKNCEEMDVEMGGKVDSKKENKSSADQLACLISVTPRLVEVYSEPNVINVYPMTPSEYIHESVKTGIPSIRSWANHSFISVPVRDEVKQTVGVICFRLSSETSLTKELRSEVGRIVSACQVCFWKLSQYFGWAQLPGQVCCGAHSKQRGMSKSDDTDICSQFAFLFYSQAWASIQTKIASFSARDLRELLKSVDIDNSSLTLFKFLQNILDNRDGDTSSLFASMLAFDPFGRKATLITDEDRKAESLHEVCVDEKTPGVVSTIFEWLQMVDCILTPHPHGQQNPAQTVS